MGKYGKTCKGKDQELGGEMKKLIIIIFLMVSASAWAGDQGFIKVSDSDCFWEYMIIYYPENNKLIKKETTQGWFTKHYYGLASEKYTLPVGWELIDIDKDNDKIWLKRKVCK